ncbi:succinate--hydroxymethylglutarate -transferase [Pelobates cultripes]|uniref:Succinate--hydroxymethylglutarate -transferase n=1 Tax=Pelobates cultripes TaxID=61616 RepID=A0AAD1W3X0_PELCU|nr:succinate--hydroxymethylglutarate -transferase [Pelobates cultripes]
MNRRRFSFCPGTFLELAPMCHGLATILEPSPSPVWGCAGSYFVAVASLLSSASVSGVKGSCPMWLRSQVTHNGLILDMEHPTAGKISVPGPAVRFSDFDMPSPIPPPLIGQHTVEILKAHLGYKDDYIDELIKTKVVVQNEIQ